MSKKLDELQDAATDQLLRYFRAPQAGRESITTKEATRTALGSLAAVGRIKATERAGDATQFAVLRDLTEDRDEMKEYVATMLPHLDPVKKLQARPKK